ncbi:MAG: antimicrobial resistance protein Mig-14 [Zoogloeaceae bacterium]|jgi:CelD/BcsL family acetyltransferase involved in cellulose biosynthesis|nr:antimicrobial resistance protein Mig-14 [Zoogloeaceae bacterium]
MMRPGLLLRGWRERGWREIDAAAYAEIWRRYGGSVATHPLAVAELSQLAGIPARYLAWPQGAEKGAYQAAIAAWGRDLALSKMALKRLGKKGLFDLGNAEVILPVAVGARVSLRHGARYLSILHRENILTARPQAEPLALARAPEEFSGKFRYNQRRERRLAELAGGEVRFVRDFSPEAFAALYLELFQRRWGFAATGAAHMAEVFTRLQPLLRGAALLIEGRPVAAQVLYRAESPDWISVEYVNGGVDPKNRAFSPGSILTFANLQNAWEEARARGKSLRYSFGRADRDYKQNWCHVQSVLRV